MSQNTNDMMMMMMKMEDSHNFKNRKNSKIGKAGKTKSDDESENNNKANIWEGFRLASPGRLPHDGKFSRDHSPHVTDEVVNVVTHGSGFLLSFLGGLSLIVKSAVLGDPFKIIAFTIYSIGLMGMFGASSMHHAIEGSADLERILLTIDYVAIFPLIAGTFTPICMVVLRNSWVGWTFLSVLWITSGLGISATLVSGLGYKTQIPKYMTTTVYICLGWMGALLAPALFAHISIGGIMCLVIGGLFFTVGGVVFTIEEPNPKELKGIVGFHEIWHILVFLGCLSHYIFMFLYILPYEK